MFTYSRLRLYEGDLFYHIKWNPLRFGSVAYTNIKTKKLYFSGQHFWVINIKRIALQRFSPDIGFRIILFVGHTTKPHGHPFNF